MTNNHQNVVSTQVLAEQQQGHETRMRPFRVLEELLGRPAILYVTGIAYDFILGRHKVLSALVARYLGW